MTAPGGAVYVSAFSVDDEYYAALINDDQGSYVVDPRNGIAKQLYTGDELKSIFGRVLRAQYFAKFEFEDIVLGAPYRRRVFILILRK